MNTFIRYMFANYKMARLRNKFPHHKYRLKKARTGTYYIQCSKPWHKQYKNRYRIADHWRNTPYSSHKDKQYIINIYKLQFIKA